MADTVDTVRIRGAVARLMVEDHLDWQQILEGELAQLLGVAPGREPFTWRWHDHVAEGIGIDDECPICLARSDYWSGGKCEVCSDHSDGKKCEDCGGPGVSWEDGLILCDDCAILRAKRAPIDGQEFRDGGSDRPCVPPRATDREPGRAPTISGTHSDGSGAGGSMGE